ncbi:MAG: hypothetical protein I3273_02470 [Candidatus Moeniiplasma glomeromycotorum]|nr:hypothetical protein [Candidatus Moeniiplasma glomeromycotorum]MCE8167018.1 hypothetical protein [Candidatus Moeniiplasma glomeromycotorum]MCE8168970.1 hypothetical protein [Candidatus Moeniiplasma glomeromycotorum]
MPSNSTLQQAQNWAIQQLKNKLPQIQGTNSQQQQTLSNIYGQIIQSQPNQQAITTYQNQKAQQLNLLSEVNNLLEEIKTKRYETIPQIEEDIKKLEKFEISEPNSNEFWVRYYSLFSEKFIYLREHLKSVSCELEYKEKLEGEHSYYAFTRTDAK